MIKYVGKIRPEFPFRGECDVRLFQLMGRTQIDSFTQNVRQWTFGGGGSSPLAIIFVVDLLTPRMRFRNCV